MDTESKKRLKRELAKAMGKRKACEKELGGALAWGVYAYWLGRMAATDVEIESLLHRLAQEG